MDYSKNYIRNWFLEHNPSYEPNIEDIYLEVEDQLEGLEPAACRIVLSSFLALNYSNKYKEKVEEILLDDYSEISKGWSEVGIFNSELGCIIQNIERRLVQYPEKSEEEVIKTYILDYMISSGELVIDDFAEGLKESRKLSDEEEAKFTEVEHLYQEKGLAKNQRICPKCNEVISSTHTHDFVQCKCGYLGIDGGMDYTNVHILF